MALSIASVAKIRDVQACSMTGSSLSLFVVFRCPLRPYPSVFLLYWSRTPELSARFGLVAPSCLFERYTSLCFGKTCALAAIDAGVDRFEKWPVHRAPPFSATAASSGGPARKCWGRWRSASHTDFSDHVLSGLSCFHDGYALLHSLFPAAALSLGNIRRGSEQPVLSSGPARSRDRFTLPTSPALDGSASGRRPSRLITRQPWSSTASSRYSDSLDFRDQPQPTRPSTCGPSYHSHPLSPCASNPCDRPRLRSSPAPTSGPARSRPSRGRTHLPSLIPLDLHQNPTMLRQVQNSLSKI